MIQFVKKSVSVLSAFLLLFIGMVQPFPSAFPVYAEEEETLTYGDFEYSVSEFGEVTIVNYTNYGAEEVTVPATIDGNTVGIIGSQAFAYKSSLKSVTLPRHIRVIRSSAFAYCDNLSSINLPESLNVIDMYAFRNCKALKEITLPKALWFVECCIFMNTGIESINIPPYLSEVDDPFAKSNISSITFDPECTQIVSKLFDDCDKLESVVIPEGITTINAWSFAFCDNLTSVKLPSTLTRIGSFAFENCPNLTSMEFPEGLISIGGYAFEDCKKLAEVKLPSTLQSLGGQAFGNTAMESIVLPAALTYGTNTFEDSILKEATLTEGMTTVPDNLFNLCVTLKKVVMPDSITSIGVSSFANCISLEQFIVAKSVESIGETAFQNCTSLTDLAILNPECEIFDADTTIDANSTIYGNRNSTAEAYAKKYGRTFIALNNNLEYDFNADGAFSVADIVLFTRVLAEDPTVNLPVCDVDGDEILTILDVGMLFEFLQTQEQLPDFISMIS